MEELELPRASTLEELHEYLKFNQRLVDNLSQYITFPGFRMIGYNIVGTDYDLRTHSMISWILDNADPSKVGLIYVTYNKVVLLPIDKLGPIHGVLRGLVFLDDEVAVMFKLMFAEKLKDW